MSFWHRRKDRMHLTVGDHDVSFRVRRDAAQAIAFLWADHEETLTQLDQAKAANARLAAEGKTLTAEAEAEAEAVAGTANAMRDAFLEQIRALELVIDGLDAALALERKARQASQAEVHRLDEANVKLDLDLGRERDEHRATKRELADERNGKVVVP